MLVLFSINIDLRNQTGVSQTEPEGTEWMEWKYPMKTKQSQKIKTLECLAQSYHEEAVEYSFQCTV